MRLVGILVAHTCKDYKEPALRGSGLAAKTWELAVLWRGGRWGGLGETEEKETCCLYARIYQI